MGREFELKYAATEAELALLRSRYPQLTPIAMETTYYDTPAGTLGKLHWTLRRRMENGKSVCTLKTPLPDGSRGEWETECDKILNAIEPLCALGAPKQLALLTAGGVEPVCGAKFTRLAGRIDANGCTVELALDRGVLTGGRKILPFAEVEVELKDGAEAAAVAFAEALARELGLRPEPRSKVARARALAQQ
ncbi:MAG: CYTH domain-containing protein [Clostridiales bacterium]|nr:CYTH domain-containing protein [Clostridiales bacterium]